MGHRRPGGLCFGRDPQVNGKEKVCEKTMVRGRIGERNDEPLGVEPARELVNAQGNYAGLAEITLRKIVIPP